MDVQGRSVAPDLSCLSIGRYYSATPKNWWERYDEPTPPRWVGRLEEVKTKLSKQLLA